MRIQRTTLDVELEQVLSGPRGIALDIDDTLAATNLVLAHELSKKFGNPEGLTPEELVSKYRYMYTVPYWRGEPRHYADGLLTDTAFMRDLPVYGDATLVSQVTHFPVAAYLTGRVENMFNCTHEWLTKNKFPIAPLLLKPHSAERLPTAKWKANTLEFLSEIVAGVVDDDANIQHELSATYRGIIYLFSHQGESTRNTQPCNSWSDVFAALGIQ